jgi:hypothetical protein
MLAYVFWHRPADGVGPGVYEHSVERFHRSLAARPPQGLRGSACYRAVELPWLGHAAGYEDWYLVEDFAALGVLNEAAVGRGHRTAHDRAARQAGDATGGLYRLCEGAPDVADARVAVWVQRPPSSSAPELGSLLGDGMDPLHAGLWQRQLTLGPAPEHCLLTPEPPPGVAPTRLPNGWSAALAPREPVWTSVG